MHTLIVICSKSPNTSLITCIDLLYKNQIRDDLLTYKICVIDSDSDDFTNYEKIKIIYPGVDIFYAKNKNYEYGAWKFAYEMYPMHDIYFCIQDTMFLHKRIDLSVINDKCIYTWHRDSGFNEHLSIKERGVNMIEKMGIHCETLTDTLFNMAYGCIFIVNNNVMNDIFKTLTIPPIDKSGSCIYERIFGLYFISKNIICINLKEYLNKIHAFRI